VRGVRENSIHWSMLAKAGSSGLRKRGRYPGTGGCGKRAILGSRLYWRRREVSGELREIISRLALAPEARMTGARWVARR
jgi:hypothetical protein